MGSLRELVSVVSIFEAVSVAKTVTNSSSKSIGEAVDMAVPIVAVVVAVGVDLPSEHAGAAAEARVVLVGAVPCLHDQVAVGKTGIIRTSVWNMDGCVDETKEEKGPSLIVCLYEENLMSSI